MDNDINSAMEEWQKAIGEEHVIANKQMLEEVSTATYPTEQRILGILKPADTEEVQECVKVANFWRIALYPVSCGHNWGFGSKVPVETGAVLLDLSRLNRITDYSEQFATLTVEAGVTFQQCFEYLQEQQSKLFFSVIGGPPKAGPVGNVLERGDGVGPYGERFNYICGMTVVLPDSSLLHTGNKRIAGSKSAKTFPYGLGPNFEGMFSQSNLGIVTEITFYLHPVPENFELTLFYTDSDEGFICAIDNLQKLYLNGTLNAPFYFWNDYKQMTGLITYPWEEAGGATPLPPYLMQKYKKKFKFGKWNGLGGIYQDDPIIKRVVKRKVKKSLAPHMSALKFFNKMHYAVVKKFEPLFLKFSPQLKLVINLWENNPFIGNPSQITQNSLYWRKKKVNTEQEQDPNIDRCGVIWNCCVIPFSGKEITKVTNHITDIILRYGFEPNVAFLLSKTGRYIRMFFAIIYDRDEQQDEENIMKCHYELFDFLESEGYTHNRLDISTMNRMPCSNDAHQALYDSIKNAIDPNNIVAPGRYSRF